MKSRNHRTRLGTSGHNRKTDISVEKRYGMLTIVREVEPRIGNGWKKRRVECLCDCGNLKEIVLGDLRIGDHVSCGCLKVERARNFKLAHGQGAGNRTPTYRAWKNMWSRVRGNRPTWERCYVERGITVCDRWRKFEYFLEDVGEKPNDQSISLDRINNDGNYEPGNTRWATKQEQSDNSRVSRPIEFQGESMSLSAWAKKLGWKYSTVAQRYRKGWSIERTLTTPLKQ
jgi:hypothetical protein